LRAGAFLRQLFGSRKKSSSRRIFEVTKDYKCLPVGDLPCEGNIKTLNQLQSCFLENYIIDNNCLVVSSTGSGKQTLIYTAGNSCLNEGRKAVVTAPSRELVKEIYDTAVSIFGRHVVGLYTGKDKSAENKHMVVATPEGYLSGLRGNRDWASQASLLIVDEAHNLVHPSRGRCLDAAITMFLRMGGKALLMSGTFPNAKEVSEHLDADLFIAKYEKTRIIRREIHAPDDLDAMPQPKQTPAGMVATGTGHIYNKDSVRLAKLKEILEKKARETVLIFVPLKAQGFCLSHALNIPFHCREVDEEQKRAMIADFRAGRLRALVATETLSQGINTPTDVTVVFGGRRGGYYLDSTDIRQKEGRGGRGKDTAESFLIGDKVELVHMKKSVYAKTLPLPTEEMLLTILSMKNASREELCSAMLSTYASRLMSPQKVIEAVNRYIIFLDACHILREKHGAYRLTEEGALLARYFIPPSQYMGYIKLARKLMDQELGEIESGCILASSLMPAVPNHGCPSRLEKDFVARCS
jgi:replicative superfamily II helicase